MRALRTTATLVVAFGLTGLLIGCNSGGGVTLNFVNPNIGMFSGSLPDANSDGTPEVDAGTGVTVYTDPTEIANCDTFEVEVVSATVTYLPEIGTMNSNTDEDTGPDALCVIDAHQAQWSIPDDAVPGIYSLTMRVDVTFVDGSTASGEVTDEIQVTL